jgi:hypothetical protein
LSSEHVVAMIEGILETLSKPGALTHGALARDRQGAALESSQDIRELGVSFSLLGAIEAQIEPANHQRAVIKDILHTSIKRSLGRHLEIYHPRHTQALLDLLTEAAASARLIERRVLGYPEPPSGDLLRARHQSFRSLLYSLEYQSGWDWDLYMCCGNITPTLRADADEYIRTLRTYFDEHPEPAITVQCVHCGGTRHCTGI